MSFRDTLLEREKEIRRILNKILDKKIKIIIVGGYGVATYKKIFSIDLDIVVKEENLIELKDLLAQEIYFLNYDKKIELFYGEKFERFSKNFNGVVVDIDLLINGLVSRTTDCTWSFDYIEKYSTLRELEGIIFLTPEKELLMAMKFHSGRLSDIRDIVALMPCNIKKLESHLLKGDLKKLKNSVEKQRDFLNKPQFDDSFKGIFGVVNYNKKDVDQAKELIKSILPKLN